MAAVLIAVLIIAFCGVALLGVVLRDRAEAEEFRSRLKARREEEKSNG